MRILNIEDEPVAARYVAKGLAESGHVVDTSSTGEEGLYLATTASYDLILLDVLLRGADGWNVLQGIRARQQTPILLLSARRDVEDCVKGLDLGADDYLVRPFAFVELLARIRSATRRNSVGAQASLVMRVGDLELNPVRRAVTRAGKVLALTPKEFALLDYLMRHAGEVMTRTLIAENVWDVNFDSDTNVIDVGVKRLRSKVDDARAHKLIHTVRGVGYVLDERI